MASSDAHLDEAEPVTHAWSMSLTTDGAGSGWRPGLGQSMGGETSSAGDPDRDRPVMRIHPIANGQPLACRRRRMVRRRRRSATADLLRIDPYFQANCSRVQQQPTAQASNLDGYAIWSERRVDLFTDPGGRDAERCAGPCRWRGALYVTALARGG